MKITVSECRDCGRPMISRVLCARYPALRGRYMPDAANGQCRACYSRAYRDAHPKPRKRPEYGRPPEPCRNCRTLMVPAYRHRQNPGLTARYGRHFGYGLCSICYHRARRAGQLAGWAATWQVTPALESAELARLRALVGVTAPNPSPPTRHPVGEVHA